MDPSAPNGMPRLKNRVPAIEKLCSDPAALDKTTKNHLRRIFDRLLGIVREDASVFESAHYKKAKAFGPIELIAVCCMIAHWGDTRPNGLYRGDIRGLRELLRESHVELRGNWECWSMSWKYIEDLDSIRGTIDGSTSAKSQGAGGGWENPTVAVRAGPPSKRTNAPTVPKMLGRGKTPGEPDSEYRPSPSARKVGPAQRKQPTKAFKPNAPSQGFGKSASPKPFAGHRPVYNPENAESSSSSSSDDDASGENASITKAAPAITPSSARKRAILDLGSGNNAALDLEAKKAKLMAGRIKQEP